MLFIAYCNIVVNPVCVVCRVTKISIKCIIGSTVIIPRVPQHHSFHMPAVPSMSYGASLRDPCLSLCQIQGMGVIRDLVPPCFCLFCYAVVSICTTIQKIERFCDFE